MSSRDAESRLRLAAEVCVSGEMGCRLLRGHCKRGSEVEGCSWRRLGGRLDKPEKICSCVPPRQTASVIYYCPQSQERQAKSARRQMIHFIKCLGIFIWCCRGQTRNPVDVSSASSGTLLISAERNESQKKLKVRAALNVFSVCWAPAALTP